MRIGVGCVALPADPRVLDDRQLRGLAQRRVRQFNNTNALVNQPRLANRRLEDRLHQQSGKCLVMQAWLFNKPMIIVLLDSFGRFTRVAGRWQVKRWLEKTRRSSRRLPRRCRHPSDRPHEKGAPRRPFNFDPDSLAEPGGGR